MAGVAKRAAGSNGIGGGSGMLLLVVAAEGLHLW
tara:strand:- start:1884 stop:1985 length:102 start_codon:yes stop_codon:yes gene_type:complete